VEAFTEQLKQRLADAAEGLQQRSPRLDPAAEWEELKVSAISITKDLHQQLKREQQGRGRQLRQQLAAAKGLAQRYPSAFYDRKVLDAEQDLTVFETTQLQQQVEATEPLWEVYGETSSFWFHRLGRAPQEPQFIAEVVRPDGSTVQAQGEAGVRAVGDLLADFYDSATGGLFSRHPTDPQQQQAMLAAVDKQLSEEQ
jgi:hypothetical protein